MLSAQKCTSSAEISVRIIVCQTYIVYDNFVKKTIIKKKKKKISQLLDNSTNLIEKLFQTRIYSNVF